MSSGEDANTPLVWYASHEGGLAAFPTRRAYWRDAEGVSWARLPRVSMVRASQAAAALAAGVFPEGLELTYHIAVPHPEGGWVTTPVRPYEDGLGWEVLGAPKPVTDARLLEAVNTAYQNSMAAEEDEGT